MCIFTTKGEKIAVVIITRADTFSESQPKTEAKMIRGNIPSENEIT